MYNKIKSLLALSFALTLGLSFASVEAASGDTATGSTFSMTEVSVVDTSTLKVSFSNDLLEDTSMFEFLLTPKADDTVEVALTGAMLTSLKELTINTVEPLTPGTEYNMVVVFASDKDGNVIENGVDGMVTVTVPADSASSTTTQSEMNAASSVDTTTETTTDDSTVSTETTSEVTTEVAASTAEALPQTGPAEMMVVALAMIMALGFMYVRRKA